MPRVHLRYSWVSWAILLTLCIVPFGNIYAQDGGACGDPNGEVIRFFVYESQVGIAQETLCVFAENNQIALQIEGGNSAFYFEALRTMAEAGEAPDLAVFPEARSVLDFASSGSLVSLSDLQISQDYLPIDWVSPAALCQIDGDGGIWFGLPVEGYVTSSVVWYSPPVFESYGYEVPLTWGDFVDLLDQITIDQEGTGRAALAVESATLGATFIDWLLRTEGQETLDAVLTPEASFENPDVAEALEIFQQNAAQYMWINTGDFGEALRAPFTEGLPALMSLGPGADYFLPEEVISSGEFGADGLYNFFLLPTVSGDIGQIQVSATYIAAFQQYDGGPKNGTKLILDYLASPDGAAAWAFQAQALSPNSGVSNFFEGRPALNYQAELLSNPPEGTLQLNAETLFGDISGELTNAVFSLTSERTTVLASPNRFTKISADTLNSSYLDAQVAAFRIRLLFLLIPRTCCRPGCYYPC